MAEVRASVTGNNAVGLTHRHVPAPRFGTDELGTAFPDGLTLPTTKPSTTVLAVCARRVHERDRERHRAFPSPQAWVTMPSAEAPASLVGEFVFAPGAGRENLPATAWRCRGTSVPAELIAHE